MVCRYKQRFFNLNSVTQVSETSKLINEFSSSTLCDCQLFFRKCSVACNCNLWLSYELHKTLTKAISLIIWVCVVFVKIFMNYLCICKHILSNQKYVIAFWKISLSPYWPLSIFVGNIRFVNISQINISILFLNILSLLMRIRSHITQVNKRFFMQKLRTEGNFTGMKCNPESVDHSLCQCHSSPRAFGVFRIPVFCVSFGFTSSSCINEYIVKFLMRILN